jgi:integrase
MQCPKCSREIPDDAAFCPYCGKRVPQAAAEKPDYRRHVRGNGSGYAYRRGKTWTAVYTYGWDKTDPAHQKQLRSTKGGFKKKADALAYCLTLKAQGVRQKAPNLLHYWNLYEAGELEKLSKSKQTAYKIAWGKLASIQYRPVDALTIKDLRDIVALKAPTYYPARDMKTVLMHLFRLAAADRYAQKELPEFIILPELNEKERKPFTSEEQAALWRIYDNGDRRAALPLIMIYTGMMPGEMQALKCDMVDVDAQRITGAGLKTKVRRESPIYLPDTIIPVIIGEIAASTSKVGYVWPHMEDKFYENYYAALEAAHCRRLEPYSCRHTTATALAITEGIAPQTIRKVMRWSTTKMLDKYAHPDDADAMEAVNHLRRHAADDAPADAENVPEITEKVSADAEKMPDTGPPV